jgi:hypothetical protein
MQTVNTKIGGILGRADIALGRGGPSTQSVSQSDPTYGPTLGGQAGASGSFSIGQLSAVQLMGLIGVWIAFYWWTHKHQG